MIALSPTDLGNSPLATTIEVVMVLIGILIILSQAVKLPFIIWLGKRIFKPAFKAVIEDPLKRWHTENVTAVVTTAVDPLRERLEREFGGNSGGMREAINTLDRKVDENREEFIRKLEQHRNDSATQQGKIWHEIKSLKKEITQ